MDNIRTDNVSLRHVICSEILAVTSVMRKNSRWATPAVTLSGRDSALASSLGLRVSGPSTSNQGSGRGGRERDLMTGFQVLKRTVQDAQDVTSLPLTTIIAPFTAIIRSPLSTGPITSAALTSLDAFFTCCLFSSSSPAVDAALIELSNTVSNCKFEATDSSGDETVLLRIMAVIEDCMCGAVRDHVGDVEACEMLETVLTTCCQMRLSEVLRRSAESTIRNIVRALFSRLHDLDAATEEEKLEKVKIATMSAELVPPPTDGASTSDAQSEGPAETTAFTASPDIPAVVPETPPTVQYGLPAVVELMRVLINILDPNDKLHTDATRLVSLRILNAGLEGAGTHLSRFPSLTSLVVDRGCKFLFQLARSENPRVLLLALRTICLIFETMPQHLKLQQELFLAFSIERLASPAPPRPRAIAGERGAVPPSPRPMTPQAPGLEALEEGDGSIAPRPTVVPARGETRELMLETLSQIARHPSFMVDLYVNYDCDINCENLFSRLVDFLVKGVYPFGVYPPVSSSSLEGLQQSSQFICLELLLSFVNYMSARHDLAGEPWPLDIVSQDELRQNKARKNLVMAGASRFNSKPKAGLAFLEENQLIYSDLSPDVTKAKSLAKFLKSCTRLDKRLLGDFLSKPDNLDILKAFIGLFDFKEKPVAEALREMLETFRLPGEAQQIDRITDAFAEIFFAAHPAEIRNRDAVYVLAYSIIMLNTDLHNRQIRKRMTIEDYQRNLRGVNDGQDFSPEFLSSIYESIRKREIVMPEEHTGQLGFEYAWKELLLRSRQAGPFVLCNTPAFDVDMFKTVWQPVISAIAHAFINFDDDYIIERAITGFRQCATLAGRFQMPDVFDFIVVSLSQATTLAADGFPSEVPNSSVVEVEGQDLTVSALSVNFGTNVKGQLAAVVLFNIVNGNGNALREGWTQIFEMFQNLFLRSLLPKRMLQMEDFLGGVSMIPLRGSLPTPAPAPAQGGLLSALSSYLMTPYGASSDNIAPSASETDIENTLSTIDCIAACRLDELYGQIIQLDVEALVAAVRALEALAHERTVARLKQQSDELNELNVSTTNVLRYDPASVFLLEMMVSIACQTPQHIEEIWSVIFEHLTGLLSTPTQYSILLIERAVVGLLRVSRILATRPALRDQLYVSFDLLARLPPVISSAVSEQTLAGLTLIIQNQADIIRSATEWNVVFAVIRSTMTTVESSRVAFDLVSSIASASVNRDNFLGVVATLEAFASAASLAVEYQQQPGAREQAITSANSPIVDRGRKAIDRLSNLAKSIPTLAQTGPQFAEAWSGLCYPLLSALGRQSTNTSREIRHASISQLQRVLLGPHVGLSGGEHRAEVEQTFDQVIFPLLEELLKPEVFQRDPLGMPETRLRASNLLCKAFMHFEVRDGPPEADIKRLWIQILDLLDRLMNVDKRDQLHEAIPETLKNVLLVMNAAGVLVPPNSGSDPSAQDEKQRAFWEVTQERVHKFLPGLMPELFPPGSTAPALAPALSALPPDSAPATPITAGPAA